MKIDTDKKYPGKLLLFGEYTVLIGSQALALPLKQYFGTWTDQMNSSTGLSKFWDFLKSECCSFLHADILDYYSANCTFRSNIPYSSGLGSSGALSAAVYDVARIRNELIDLKSHQSFLAKIESYFHGKSSGFDPLISFYNRAILQNKDGEITFPAAVNIPETLFLYHSRDSRSQAGLIPQFLEKQDQRKNLIADLVDQNNRLIECILENSTSELNSLFRQISKIQWELMPEYISPQIKAIWQTGLDRGGFSIKLCGAGGGGYYMVCLHEPHSFPTMERLIPLTLDNSLGF